jgi:hypothetical protein
VAPKHRRPEIEPSPASTCALANTAETWPEAVGNGQDAAVAGPIAVQAGWPAGNGHLARNVYYGGAADPGWAAAREGQSWRELQWQDRGPLPAVHADHPSAPIRRIQFPVGYPPEPVPALRAPSAKEAQDYAAAIREAAEREAVAITQQATSQAAAIRQAAEREAAELRARLDSMSGELGRVAAHVTESLAGSASPATATALPREGSALSGTRSAKPAATPARPSASAAGKRQKRSRQSKAMRIATCGTAALFSFAVISGVTEVGLHGYKFFVFREGGVGQTPGNETDQQFLARQAAVTRHVESAKGGRHCLIGIRHKPKAIEVKTMRERC